MSVSTFTRGWSFAFQKERQADICLFLSPQSYFHSRPAFIRDAEVRPFADCRQPENAMSFAYIFARFDHFHAADSSPPLLQFATAFDRRSPVPPVRHAY